MMKKHAYINLLIIILLFSVVCIKHAWSWDNNTTHKDLSQIAAEKSALGPQTNFLHNIGFDKGLSEILAWSGKSLKTFEWIRDGAFYEDAGSDLQGIAGIARYSNHFHNPLKPWAEAGLDDWVLLLHYTGESSLIWSQDSTKQSGWLGGDWTWQATRIFFYNALTKNTDSERQAYFAQTFRGLGHQMHLIQDASQPDHVRNDAHPLPRNQTGGLNIEAWAAGKRGDINSLAATPLFPDVPFNVSHNGLAPITQLLDTDQYNGTVPSASLSQGIAEYTNANFASAHTIFAEEKPTSDIHYFPYPRKSSTDIQDHINQNKLPETVVAEDGIPDTGFWIKKMGDGENYGHFVKPTYLTDLLQGTTLYNRTLYQDTECYKDYVKFLIPRAVGYSAGLLDYFFRGSINITLPNSGIYSSTTNTALGFTTIKVQAKNTTENNEDMLNGSIELVVKYKRALEDPFKNYPEDHYLQESEFMYIVAPEKNGIRGIPGDHFIELTFDLPTPIPLWAVDVYLQVVYHGKLGNEDGAVAVGFKDISEPTPIDMSGDTDRICLNGTFFTAGSPEAITQADNLGNHNGIADDWDIYAHSIKDIYIRTSPSTPQYASATNYTFYIPALAAGGFSRDFYILTDEHYNYSIIETWVNDNQSDPWTLLPSPARLYTGTAIKNQTDYVEDAALCSPDASCDIWWYPKFLSYRGRDEWWGSGVIYINNAYPQGSQCFCYSGILNSCTQ